MATAAGQAKHCAWVSWNGTDARKLPWSLQMTMEPRATYSHTNHQLWDFTGDNTRTMYLQEGQIFSHRAGVHSRCTSGVITQTFPVISCQHWLR